MMGMRWYLSDGLTLGSQFGNPKFTELFGIFKNTGLGHGHVENTKKNF